MRQEKKKKKAESRKQKAKAESTKHGKWFPWKAWDRQGEGHMQGTVILCK